MEERMLGLRSELQAYRYRMLPAVKAGEESSCLQN
jgi:hypothetical protein